MSEQKVTIKDFPMGEETFIAVRRIDLPSSVQYAFAERVAVQGLSKKEMLSDQAAFYAGACAVIQALFPDDAKREKLSSVIPPRWIICILSGRVIGVSEK